MTITFDDFLAALRSTKRKAIRRSHQSKEQI